MTRKKIIDKALEKGFDDVEIVVIGSYELSLSVFEGNPENHFLGSDETYLLKGIKKGKKALISFQKNDEDFSDSEIEDLVEKLKENIDSLTDTEENVVYPGGGEYPAFEDKDGGFDAVSVKEKTNLLKEIEKEAYETAPEIEKVQVSYQEEKRTFRIMNSQGLDLSKSSAYAVIVCQVVAAPGAEDPAKQSALEIKYVNKYDDLNPHEIGSEAAKKALALLGAAPVPSGVGPVIIDAEVMKMLLAGFFPMFTGEAVRKHLTALVGKTDEKIMSEKVTIIDDPMKEEAIIKEPFDDEGVPARYKKVVENGVLKLFLQNLKTAHAMNTEPTGNASLSGIKPFNFCLLPGKFSRDELIEKAGKGLLITGMAGLHAGLNPISGDFSAQSSGFYFENGRIVKAVTLMVVSGNFLRMMNDIEAIGNDLRIGGNGIGAPSVLFRNLRFSGA